MDDVLFHRWKDGDLTAATAVRNHVRTLAVRMLSHPALRGGEHVARHSPLRDEQARRELTAAIAREVLERGADDPQQLHASALLVSARRALELVREGRPSAPGEAHAPPAVAVLLAVAPDALPAAARDAAEQHVESCGQCKADTHLVVTIVRAQGVVDPAADIDDLAAEAARVESMQPMASVETVEPPRQGRRIGPRRTTRARVAPPRRRSAVPLLVTLLVLSIVGIYGLRFVLRMPNEAEKEALVNLVDRSPPDAPPFGVLPSESESALSDIERGDCRSGAKRLRTTRRSHPDDALLLAVEVTASICAGDSAGAAEALALLEALPDADPGEVEWLRAQLALARGDASEAIEALGDVVEGGSGRSAQARVQLAAVRDLLY